MISKSENEEILIYPEENSNLLGRSIEEYINFLTKILGPRVNEAYIFGSYATNTNRADSDIDLILVANSNRPFLERFKDFYDVL